jgi:anti-sigma-K factor RskA
MPSASENNRAGPPGDDSYLLAPWYVTGKLDNAEMRELDELTLHDPEFARLIEEAAAEADATASLLGAIDGPSPAVWRRLEASIENESRPSLRVRSAKVFSSAGNSIREFFDSFSASDWRFAAAAVLTICLVQTATIAYLIENSSSSSTAASKKFVAASGPKSAQSAVKAAFIVEFAGTATIGDISALFEAADVSIVEGPLADRVYRVGLRGGNLEIKQSAMEKLRASPIIARVLPEK